LSRLQEFGTSNEARRLQKRLAPDGVATSDRPQSPTATLGGQREVGFPGSADARTWWLSVGTWPEPCDNARILEIRQTTSRL